MFMLIFSSAAVDAGKLLFIFSIIAIILRGSVVKPHSQQYILSLLSAPPGSSGITHTPQQHS